MLSYITLYAIPVPSNAEIYVKQFRSLIDFDILKPDNFLPLINKDWSQEYFISIGKTTALSGLQSSGIQSGNIVLNLSTYIFIGLFFVFVLLLMSSLLIVRKFHDKVKAKLIDILNKTFWNNSIRSLNITYLKTALAFVVSYKIDQDMVSVMVLSVLGVIPLYFILVLIYFNAKLDTPEMKKRIERMYQDIHLGRNYLTKFYYPIFLIRRFIFVIIPVLVPFYPIIQLLALIFLNLIFLAMYVYVRPHIE